MIPSRLVWLQRLLSETRLFLGQVYAKLKSKNLSREEKYHLFNFRSDIAGYLVFGGVLLECIFLGFSDRSLLEKILGMFCDALIFIGVAGEIKFGNLAKSIGDLRIAEFNARAEEAQLKSLSLELRLAELLAPRSLTEQQMALMVETLKKFEGTPFDLSLSYSPEGARLLQQILSTLKAAGWFPKDRESRLIIRFPDTPIVGQIVSENIIIKVSPQRLKDWEQPTLALANALIIAGMKVEAVEGYEPEDDDNAIHIRIGVKT